MTSQRRFAAAIAGLATLSVLGHAHAGEGAAGQGTAAGARCAQPITRDNLVRCALERSLVARAEREQLRALEGRVTAASPILPSNPVVSVTGATRPGAGTTLAAFNWSATLSQELELAGQRGARRRTARFERDAQTQVVIATEREVALAAWRAFFELLAARERSALARRLEALSQRVLAATRGAADKGLIAAVDADVAEALFLHVAQLRIESERGARSTEHALALVLGADPEQPLVVEGELEPLPIADRIDTSVARSRIEQRPEVQELEASQRAQKAKLDFYERARWPNPTLSLFAQNDETNHSLFGLGLALPIVLPQPLGRTYRGEIEESLALSDKLGSVADQARRAARTELSAAAAAYASSRETRALFSAERLARAEQSLSSIASEIEAGRLAVRDSILPQETLMEMLSAAIEARLALCATALDLAKAADVALEKVGAP